MSIADFLEWLVLTLSERKALRAAPAAPVLPKASGVYLGESWPLEAFRFGAGEPLFLSREEMRKHVYVLGATGSGKTNLLVQLVDRDVREGRSVALLDLRGDLVDRVLARLTHAKVDASRLYLLDLRDDTHVMPFNPLSGAGELHARAFHVLGVLRSQAESWGVQLEETLRNSLVALAESKRSLVDLEGLLLDDTIRAKILASVSDPLASSFFARFGELSKERRLSLSLPVLNKVTPLLAIPRIRAMLQGAGSLDLARVLDTPGSILLVSLAVDRFHAASHLVGGLLVSGIRSAVMARASVPESSRNAVSLYIDEFETMASDSFLEILAEGRRFGLSLVLSHQNLSQLSPKLKAALMTNAHVQLYFQTGAQDASELTKEVVCKLPREELRELLMSFAPGEAALVRRGVESAGIATPLSRDPSVPRSALEALRHASYALHLPVKVASPPSAVSRPKTPRKTAWEVRDDA